MVRKALVLVVGAGFASVIHGCHSATCRETFTCPPEEMADEVSCDPAVAGIRDECPGVFVSAAGSDENPGTREQPMRSLTSALSAAQSGSRRVYACAESFIESVTIPPGVEVWGGLNCADRWSYVGETSKTMITPEPGEIPLRFVAGDERALVADVHAVAADATVPGGSSIAVLVHAGAAVEIQRANLVAGRGANGAAGTDGGNMSARAGEPGSPGGAACTAFTVQGGAGTLNECRGFDSMGGTGGTGNAMNGGSGSNGTPEPFPNPAGAGLGGIGQAGASFCEHGRPGQWGADGAHGQGAHGPGTFDEAGWHGLPGSDGADGLPGQGGGGGGGSFAGAMFCGSSLGGASGGGGGAGGCGGVAGKGGGAGGASIGVLTLSGDVQIRATSITTGRGGDGGNGGLGQLRGVGGPGGIGGLGANGSRVGCDGGRGGDGGNGGHGGGGLGGASIGIAYANGHTPLHDAMIRPGEAGKGGLGGDPYVPGSVGDDGLRGEMIGFPP